MDTTTLENWLWEAAYSIRGPLNAPKFKDYILPLLFYKRLSDVYEDELDRLAKGLGGKAKAQKLVHADRVRIISARELTRTEREAYERGN